MSKIIAITGTTGAGKTTLAQALCQTAAFAVGLEQHAERPFQTLFKHDKRYALANQVDYMLIRADQEYNLRQSPLPGLTDGGLDVDLFGFTRLFHTRGYLSDNEFELCKRLYESFRRFLPPPELVIHIFAHQDAIARRLAGRNRINIATNQDTELLDSYLEEWLATRDPATVLRLNVSNEDISFSNCLPIILEKIKDF